MCLSTLQASTNVIPLYFTLQCFFIVIVNVFGFIVNVFGFSVTAVYGNLNDLMCPFFQREKDIHLWIR